MFGKTKEDLVKAKEKADKELQAVLTEEKRQSDEAKRTRQQEEKQKKELARKIAFYHLNESEPIRFLFFIQWLSQNPSLTVPYVDSSGAARHKTFTMQQLLDQWQLTEFCKKLAHLSD